MPKFKNAITVINKMTNKINKTPIENSKIIEQLMLPFDDVNTASPLPYSTGTHNINYRTTLYKHIPFDLDKQEEYYITDKGYVYFHRLKELPKKWFKISEVFTDEYLVLWIIAKTGSCYTSDFKKLIIKDLPGRVDWALCNGYIERKHHPKTEGGATK